MKNNIWKILAIVFFVTSLIGFFWGYTYTKNIQSSNLINLNKIESRLDSTITYHKIIENISDPSVQSSINKRAEIVKSFDEISGGILFNSGTKNLRLINGVPTLISSTGKEFDLNIILNLLEKASAGELSADEIDTLNSSLPKNLADGSEFRVL